MSQLAVTGTRSALTASYMLSGGLSYNLFFWVEFGLGCLLFLRTFFFFEETMFFRTTGGSEIHSSTAMDVSGMEEKSQEQGVAQPTRPRKSCRQQLKFIGTIDLKSPIFMMMVRSSAPGPRPRPGVSGNVCAHANLRFIQGPVICLFFLVPPVLWVCATYGKENELQVTKWDGKLIH